MKLQKFSTNLSFFAGRPTSYTPTPYYSNEHIQDNALRVIPAVTRLTVYRRLPVVISIFLKTQTFVCDFKKIDPTLKHVLSDGVLKIKMLLVYNRQTHPPKSHHRVQLLDKNGQNFENFLKLLKLI